MCFYMHVIYKKNNKKQINFISKIHGSVIKTLPISNGINYTKYLTFIQQFDNINLWVKKYI